MAVTKAQASVISNEIQAAVDAILSKHGLVAGKVRTTYGDMFAFKVEATPLVKGENGVNLESIEAKDYLRFGNSYGLNAGLLGKKFVSNGDEYVFAGIAISRKKYPIVATKVLTGTTMFFTETVKTKLNALA